jgi:hypothetical protein
MATDFIRFVWNDWLGVRHVDIIPEHLAERFRHRVCINGGSVLSENLERAW